jgi:hypothetical protein
MKSNIKIVSISLFLSVLFMLASSGGQKAEWKGTIELEMPRSSLQKGIFCISIVYKKEGSMRQDENISEKKLKKENGVNQSLLFPYFSSLTTISC